MQSGPWDTLFNILILVFWFRTWVQHDRDLVLNTYLSPIARVSNRAFDALKPFALGAPRQVISLGLLIALIALRGLAVPRGASWVLIFGFRRLADTSSLLSCMAFSVLSFGIFLFKLWALALLYTRTRRGTPSEHTASALYQLARPFTHLKPEIRPAALVAFGMAMALLIDAAGHPVYTRLLPSQALAVDLGRNAGSVLVIGLRLWFVALAGFTQILQTLASFMILLLIGALVSTFTGAPNVVFFCRNWTTLLLGPLRRFPLHMGMLDLTPLVFLIAANFLHRVLMAILQRGCDALL